MLLFLCTFLSPFLDIQDITFWITQELEALIRCILGICKFMVCHALIYINWWSENCYWSFFCWIICQFHHLRIINDAVWKILTRPENLRLFILIKHVNAMYWNWITKPQMIWASRLEWIKLVRDGACSSSRRPYEQLFGGTRFYF